MGTENGAPSNDIEFTNIVSRNDAAADNNANSHPLTPSKGPWTHSANSYSRKETSPDTKHHLKQQTLCVFGILCTVVFIVGIALGVVIGVFAVNKPNSEDDLTHSKQKRVGDVTLEPRVAPSPCVCNPCACKTTTQHSITTNAPVSPKANCTRCKVRKSDQTTYNEVDRSVFAPLTTIEISKVLKFMKREGLVSYTTSITSNRASHVYLYPVDKSVALQFLDKGGTFPGRYAKVHVIRGARLPHDVMEYKVGPLHETDDKIIVKNLTADGEIDFNRRPYDSAEITEQTRVVSSHLKAMDKLFRESFDGAEYTNGMRTSFDYLPTKNLSDRTSLLHMGLSMQGYVTLRSVPVTCTVHHPGTDFTKWYASDFYYLSQGPYVSGEALQNAYDTDQLRKLKLPKNYRQDHNKEFNLLRNSTLPDREHSNLPPPRTYEPMGSRYTIKGNVIQWMDWEFEYSANSVRGPAIYNIKFKGTRIAYEISLQDVTLIYSSQSNGAGPPVLSDTFYFLGNFNSPRRGVDCPERSSILYTAGYIYGYTRDQAGACLFEADGQSPLWRHGSQGLADHYLVIRYAMNLGNYDYFLEWQFHLDGHLETKISASGYLYGAFWDPEDPLVNREKSSTPFGFRIADYLLGPIHDHAFSFKVDIDILGTKNSFETVHWKAGSVLNALQSQTNTTTTPGYFRFNTTRYLEHEIVEKESGFVMDQMKPKYWIIANEKERNAWNVKRGYRIISHSTSAEYLDNHEMFGAWEHLKYHLVVTKRKDSEPHSTMSLYDLIRPTTPFKGLGNMMDNEPIRNEDLVLWVTEKFMHAPSSEDLPMTLQVNKGFSLKPFNYFDRAATFDVKGHYYPNSVPYKFEPCYENV